MIKQIICTPQDVAVGASVSNKITFELYDDGSKTGYFIKKIEGLGPVKASINTSTAANKAGVNYVSSKKEPRNIVLTLGLRSTSVRSVEYYRQYLYKMFRIGRGVTINVITDNRNVVTFGYVEYCEPDIFSSEEDVVISIICPDSNMKKSTENTQVISWNTPNNLFNLNLTTDGECNVGFRLELTFGVAGVPIFSLRNSSGQTFVANLSSISIGSNNGVLARDKLILNTNYGEKGVYILRNNVHHSILDVITYKSKWFELLYGLNTFSLTFGPDVTTQPGTLKVFWTDEYEGV